MYSHWNKIRCVSNKRVEIKRMSPWIGDWSSNKSRSPENYRPYLLTCYVPMNKNTHAPSAISIIDNRSQKRECHHPSNYLKVVYNIGEKKDFAVCVRGLHFLNNISLKLIEWIELMSLMGANKYFCMINLCKEIWK